MITIRIKTETALNLVPFGMKSTGIDGIGSA